MGNAEGSHVEICTGMLLVSVCVLSVYECVCECLCACSFVIVVSLRHPRHLDS